MNMDITLFFSGGAAYELSHQHDFVVVALKWRCGNGTIWRNRRPENHGKPISVWEICLFPLDPNAKIYEQRSLLFKLLSLTLMLTVGAEQRVIPFLFTIKVMANTSIT